MWDLSGDVLSQAGIVPWLLCPKSFDLNSMLIYFLLKIISVKWPCSCVHATSLGFSLLSPFLQAALFLLFPLFKVDLTAMTSILLADGAVCVLALPTCTPDTCPRVPLTLNPPQPTVLGKHCKHPAARICRLGAGRNSQEIRCGSALIRAARTPGAKSSNTGEVVPGHWGFEGQGAGTGGYLAAGWDSRRCDLWRHFREHIFMESRMGRGQSCSHPTGTPT